MARPRKSKNYANPNKQRFERIRTKCSMCRRNAIFRDRSTNEPLCFYCASERNYQEARAYFAQCRAERHRGAVGTSKGIKHPHPTCANPDVFYCN